MRRVQIKELGKVITGNTPSMKNIRFYNSNDIGFIKPDIIDSSGITHINSTNAFISENARNNARIVKNDTVLITCIGSIGKVGITEGAEYSFNQQINAIEPNDKVVAKYLAYNILSNKSRLMDIANAPVVPIINKTQFENFNIAINENIGEQKRIIKILDQTNEIITLKKNQLKEFDDLIKSRFNEMFGDGNYANQTLIEIIKEGAGLSYGIVVPGENVNNGIPMIRPSDFKNGNLILDNVYIVDYEIEKKYKKTRLEGNEILVQVIGQPGQVMLTNEDCAGMNVTRNLAVIRHDDRIVNKFYLKEFLLTIEAQTSMLGGTNQSTLMQLPLGTLKKLKVPLPPLKLQNQFADFVQQVVKLKVEVQKSMHETQVLFDSLMQEYFE